MPLVEQVQGDNRVRSRFVSYIRVRSPFMRYIGPKNYKCHLEVYLRMFEVYDTVASVGNWEHNMVIPRGSRCLIFKDMSPKSHS